MKIFITGGTGFIGRSLSKELIKNGYEVTLLMRSLRKEPFDEKVLLLEGNPNEPGPWQEKIKEHDVIINLAGASIFRRWNNKAKKEIFDSRILTTRHLVEALANRKGKETHLLNASGVGYYGFHRDEILDESSPPGNDFLAQLSSEWESEACNAKKFGVRVVLCRFGIVLGKEGGALSKMLPLFKLHLGSFLGNGKQWFPWIHICDVVNIFLFLLKDIRIEGPVNFTSPNPVLNKEMTKTLRGVLKKTTIVPFIPGFILKLILGKFAKVFLEGQRALPRKLMENGFIFQFPILEKALKNLLES